MKKKLLPQAVFATFVCSALTVFPLFTNELAIFLPEISVVGAKESSGTVMLDDGAKTGSGRGLTIKETSASPGIFSVRGFSGNSVAFLRC